MTGLNWSFIFTVINLIVLYALMQKFLYRPISNIMEQREKLIQDQLNSAKDTEKEAFELKDKYENSLLNAQKEADSIINHSKIRAQEEYDLILQNANAAAEQVRKETSKTIEIEREKTMQSISDEIAALTVSAAEKVIGKQGSSVFDQDIINEFLKEEGAFNENRE